MNIFKFKNKIQFLLIELIKIYSVRVALNQFLLIELIKIEFYNNYYIITYKV